MSYSPQYKVHHGQENGKVVHGREFYDVQTWTFKAVLLAKQVLTFMESNTQVAPPAPAMPPAPRYQLPPALIDLVNPLLVCLLAVSNFLLPSWLAGFTTGLLLTTLAAYWLVTYLHPPVSHSCTPVTASSPIPVHEPPAQVTE